MKPYADTNFLVCLYLDLAESEKAIGTVRADRAKRATLPIAWLHRLEMTNALQSYVFLTQRGGPVRVTAESAHAAHASFRSDLAQASFLVPSDLTIGELEGQFEELALRHTARHGFRTYDLLHVLVLAPRVAERTEQLDDHLLEEDGIVGQVRRGIGDGLESGGADVLAHVLLDA